MKHYVQTRFSVLHPYPKKMPKRSNYWANVGIEDHEWDNVALVNQKSAEYLYSDDRMAHKFHCFKNLTLPSVQAAMDNVEDAEWWLYISKSPKIFPQRHLDTLTKMVEHDSRIKIVEMDWRKYKHLGDHSEQTIKSFNLETRFSTTRIDDDDGLHPNILQEAETLCLSESSPFVYCATWGVKCEMLPDGSLKEGNLWQHWSQHAIGLVAVDEFIWRLGSHGNIAKNHPHLKIIHNRAKRKSFQMMCHKQFTWSSREFK